MLRAVCRTLTIGLTFLMLFAVLVDAFAQRRGRSRADPPQPRVALRGEVFIGGYFYDPIFGPYPWWSREHYPFWYFPRYHQRAYLRVRVTPENAAVHVDGFYAGIVEDFDGVFEGIPLPPGGHSIVLYLEGYRTARHNVYLAAGGTFKLHDTPVALPPGVTSEPPPFAYPVPPPPSGTYRLPRTAAPASPPPPYPAAAQTFGTLALRVQPATAAVLVDGERWVSSEDGQFLINLFPGNHRVEISELGYQRFLSDVLIRQEQTSTLNVTLVPATRD